MRQNQKKEQFLTKEYIKTIIILLMHNQKVVISIFKEDIILTILLIHKQKVVILILKIDIILIILLIHKQKVVILTLKVNIIIEVIIIQSKPQGSKKVLLNIHTKDLKEQKTLEIIAVVKEVLQLLKEEIIIIILR